MKLAGAIYRDPHMLYSDIYPVRVKAPLKGYTPIGDTKFEF